jgi:hypothetical protein
MPRAATVIHHCAWCRVAEVNASQRAACPLCDGLMIAGPPPHGTYSQLTDDEHHSVYAKMMNDTGRG